MELVLSKNSRLNKIQVNNQKVNKFEPINLKKYFDGYSDNIIKEAQHEFTSSDEGEERKTLTNQGRKKSKKVFI